MAGGYDHDRDDEVEVDHDHDLRSLLGKVGPADFSLKLAWRAVIQGLREHKRATGEVRRLTSRAAVERALDSPLRADPHPADLHELKRALRSTVRDGATAARAVQVDDLIARLLPREAAGEVVVDVVGWPDDFGPELQSRLLRQGGPPPLTVHAEVAAALAREFDGFVLAGRALSVRPRLDDGEVLPPVSRTLRARPMRRDRDGPWLPHHDDVGRRSLTPRALAQRQARRVAELAGPGGLVIDGFCGLGGNAIAFAEAGLRVIAVELASDRRSLARRNAEVMGVSDRIELRCGDIARLLPTLPVVTLFLDPPWDAIDVDALPLPEDRPVVLKLPRDFDVARLPGRWVIDYEFGEGEDDGAVVRMLTAVRGARAGPDAGGRGSGGQVGEDVVDP